ncbi:MAG: hypothetical protein U1E53_26370 [Dongiaceae bacterium]
MSEINDALTRLEAVLTRLEGAVATRGSSASVEQERLTAELDAARAGRAALEDEARSVSSRLDSVIGRLRGLLEA